MCHVKFCRVRVVIKSHVMTIQYELAYVQLPYCDAYMRCLVTLRHAPSCHMFNICCPVETWHVNHVIVDLSLPDVNLSQTLKN